MFGRGAGLTARRLGCAWALLVAHALIAPAQAALASEASGQRGHSINVRAHRASEDARKRADDTRPEPGSSARADVDRPPQFVVMAFDNCTELERWQELTDFAAQMNKDGDRLHFTFFVSAINFIADASRATSTRAAPAPRRIADQFRRDARACAQARRLRQHVHGNGHEIASHAVGHFNGASWSVGRLGQGVPRILAGDSRECRAEQRACRDGKLAFPPSEVIGFRAPYLAKGAGLYGPQAATAFATTPAASAIRCLAGEDRRRLALQSGEAADAGSGKGTLSMDYNFFVAQSRAMTDPRRYELAREQMLQTYLNYFGPIMPATARRSTSGITSPPCRAAPTTRR